ncbi:hypothetical protein Gorai_009895, partial [Gossypium raimondii]|nr:hypothetical protein [Gossypium raimondii]
KAKRQRGGFVERCFLSVGGFGCALEELREAETEYRVLDCFDAFETQKCFDVGLLCFWFAGVVLELSPLEVFT